MSSLEQNINRFKRFDSDLRGLITAADGTIPANTSCEELLEIADNLIPAQIYGVSGLYSSTPALTRTDNAVGLGYTINSGTGSIDSDFNEVFPWNKAKVVNLEQGKFLKMPEMYFRVGADSEGRLTDIAVSRRPHSEGNWYRVGEFYYGCYGASLANSKLESRSGTARRASTSRSSFRTYARNCGEGYCQLDLYHRTVMMFLWYIEFATKKSDDVMTGCISQSSADRRQTGGTDNVSTPSGFETGYNQMRYHYIEDFCGNFFEVVDGVCCTQPGSAAYVTDDPDLFSDSTAELEQLGYPSASGGCISALGWDSDNPFMCMPHSIVSNSNYNTYFCDQAALDGSSYPVLLCGSGAGSSTSNYGLTYFKAQSVNGGSAGVGARLIRIS